jgi:hypothetical protein
VEIKGRKLMIEISTELCGRKYTLTLINESSEKVMDILKDLSRLELSEKNIGQNGEKNFLNRVVEPKKPPVKNTKSFDELIAPLTPSYDNVKKYTLSPQDVEILDKLEEEFKEEKKNKNYTDGKDSKDSKVDKKNNTDKKSNIEDKGSNVDGKKIKEGEIKKTILIITQPIGYQEFKPNSTHTESSLEERLRDCKLVNTHEEDPIYMEQILKEVVNADIRCYNLIAKKVAKGMNKREKKEKQFTESGKGAILGKHKKRVANSN